MHLQSDFGYSSNLFSTCIACGTNCGDGKPFCDGIIRVWWEDHTGEMAESGFHRLYDATKFEEGLDAEGLPHWRRRPASKVEAA